MRCFAALAACFLIASPLSAAELAPVQQVQLVQSALHILGYGPGRIDGIDGRTTREALGAAAVALDWGRVPSEIDDALVLDLSRSAGVALAWRYAIRFDGRWSLDPDWWDAAMAAQAGIPFPATLAQACSADSPVVFTIDGLIYQPGGPGGPQVLTLEGDRLVPVPPEGRPAQSEAHGFAVADMNTLQTLTEGDTALWRRCPPD